MLRVRALRTAAPWITVASGWTSILVNRSPQRWRNVVRRCANVEAAIALSGVRVIIHITYLRPEIHDKYSSMPGCSGRCKHTVISSRSWENIRNLQVFVTTRRFTLVNNLVKIIIHLLFFTFFVCIFVAISSLLIVIYDRIKILCRIHSWTQYLFM